MGRLPQTPRNGMEFMIMYLDHELQLQRARNRDLRNNTSAQSTCPRDLTQQTARTTTSSQQSSRNGQNRPSTPAIIRSNTTSASTFTPTPQWPTYRTSSEVSSPAWTSNNHTLQRLVPLRRIKVLRKPIEADCHICYSPLRDSGTSKQARNEPLVWCQKQCGQNFHKSCMDLWGSCCVAEENPINCPMCRANWLAQ